MSQRMSGDMPEDIAERMSKDMSERMSEDMSERIQKICQKKCQKDMSEDMSEIMSQRMSERMAKDMSERMSKNVRKICQKICHQKECQKICHKECQKICQKDVRKNVRRYVRKNVRRYVRQNVRKYVPSICAYIDLDNKNSCLHQRNLVDGILFFVWFGTLQQVLLAQTFLCKEVSLVWQPWRRLWWNVLRRSSLGLPIGLPKELSMCGATSWLLLVLSASTCAWSRLALHMLGIWCLSWKKSWRETSGMWRMKGGLFQMRRSSKSWRSALQSFVLRPRFGRMECTSGRQMMCGAGPPTQKRWKNRSGKRRASWCAHAMRCSCGTTARIASLGLNCFLAGRSDACGVCVCVELQAFCIFGLNSLLAGRSDALRAMTFAGTKLSWILLLLRGVR